MLDQAILQLQRAKDQYAHALVQIDRLLSQIVTNDPSLMADAKALQAAAYRVDATPRELKLAEHPDAEVPEAKVASRVSKSK